MNVLIRISKQHLRSYSYSTISVQFSFNEDIYRIMKIQICIQYISRYLLILITIFHQDLSMKCDLRACDTMINTKISASIRMRVWNMQNNTIDGDFFFALEAMRKRLCSFVELKFKTIFEQWGNAISQAWALSKYYHILPCWRAAENGKRHCL